jgi:hypothetical protein
MGEEQVSVSFRIQGKPKESKPEMAKVVSSLFAPAPKEPAPDQVPIHKFAKPSRKRAPRPSNQPESPPTETPFLRMLRQRQMGIAPNPPVPARDAFSPDVPISGFGQVCLREQGLEPGQNLGSAPPH